MIIDANDVIKMQKWCHYARFEHKHYKSLWVRELKEAITRGSNTCWDTPLDEAIRSTIRFLIYDYDSMHGSWGNIVEYYGGIYELACNNLKKSLEACNI